MVGKLSRASSVVAVIAAWVLGPSTIGVAGEATPPTGLWRGTSTCTDRVAAPACKDEVVVYEFKLGDAPGTVQWQADKIVNGQRQPMGELDLRYDARESCWKAQFDSPRSSIVWCLNIDGKHMTGTGQVLPGNQVVRRIDVQRETPLD